MFSNTALLAFPIVKLCVVAGCLVVGCGVGILTSDLDVKDDH